MGKEQTTAEARNYAKLKQLEELKKRVLEATKPDPNRPECGHIADMITKWPLVVSLMTCHLLKGGPDEGATITLWGKDEGLGGVFNAWPLQRKAFITAGSLQEWLDEAEELLANPDSRLQKPGKQKRSRRPQGRTKH